MAKQITAPGTDNNEFVLVRDFPGYNSAADPTIIKPGYLTQGSINVYKKSSGAVGNRPGRKLYDVAADTTVAGVKAGKVWRTSLGETFPIRCANGKLEVESDVTGTRVWYTLLSSLTLTRFIFDSWWHNTDKKDKLLMVNGGTNIYDWSGGFALFVSYLAGVITLDRSAATAGFASSGSVTINGIDYTYTGISGSTLTGTSNASAASANQVVMQKIVTTTNASLTSGPGTEYVNDFIRVVGNQLYLGSYTSRLVYVSRNSDYKDFGQSTPRLRGEGDLLTLDDTGRGIGIRQGLAHIFGGSDALYIISFSQITVGAVLSEQVLVDKIQLGNLVAATGQEFIDSLADNVIYMDQANQVRSFGSFRNFNTARAVLLSQDIMDELFLTDFTGGQLRVVSDRHGDSIYITAPNSSYVYWYQESQMLSNLSNVTATRIWQPPQIWGVSRIDSIADSLGRQQAVGFSNANPQMYFLWDTSQYVDDLPSGQAVYNSIALFAYQQGGRRQGKIVFEKTYVEGYCTQGTNLYLGIYFDYQGSTTIISPLISNVDSRFTDAMLFIGAIPPSLGDASLGDNPLGDGLNTALDDQFTLPKFRVVVGTQPENCYEFAPMIYSQDAGDRWEILALGANIHLAEVDSGVEITK